MRSPYGLSEIDSSAKKPPANGKLWQWTADRYS